MSQSQLNLEILYDKVLEFNENQPDEYFDSLISYLSENPTRIQNTIDNLIAVFANNHSLKNALHIVFMIVWRLGAPAFFGLENSGISELTLDPITQHDALLELKRITKYCIEKAQKMEISHELPNIGTKYVDLCQITQDELPLVDVPLTEFEKQYAGLAVKFLQLQQRLEVLLADCQNDKDNHETFEKARGLELLELIDGIVIEPDQRFNKSENDLLLLFYHQKYALINQIYNEFPQIAEDYRTEREEKKIKEQQQQPQMGAYDIKNSTVFVEGGSLERCPESTTLAYYDYIYPFRSPKMGKKLKETICAFLNTNGGRILIGAGRDGKRVKGLLLTQSCQEALIRDIENLLVEFHPKVDAEEVRTVFVPVKKRDGSYKLGFYVVKIIVKRGKPNDLYFTSEHCYKRCDSHNEVQRPRDFKRDILERSVITIQTHPEHFEDRGEYSDAEPELGVPGVNVKQKQPPEPAPMSVLPEKSNQSVKSQELTHPVEPTAFVELVHVEAPQESVRVEKIAISQPTVSNMIKVGSFPPEDIGREISYLVKACGHLMQKASDSKSIDDYVLFYFDNREDAIKAHDFLTDNNFTFKGNKLKVEYFFPEQMQASGAHQSNASYPSFEIPDLLGSGLLFSQQSQPNAVHQGMTHSEARREESNTLDFLIQQHQLFQQNLFQAPSGSLNESAPGMPEDLQSQKIQSGPTLTQPVQPKDQADIDLDALQLDIQNLTKSVSSPQHDAKEKVELNSDLMGGNTDSQKMKRSGSLDVHGNTTGLTFSFNPNTNYDEGRDRLKTPAFGYNAPLLIPHENENTQKVTHIEGGMSTADINLLSMSASNKLATAPVALEQGSTGIDPLEAFNMQEKKQKSLAVEPQAFPPQNQQVNNSEVNSQLSSTQGLPGQFQFAQSLSSTGSTQTVGIPQIVAPTIPTLSGQENMNQFPQSNQLGLPTQNAQNSKSMFGRPPQNENPSIPTANLIGGPSMGQPGAPNQYPNQANMRPQETKTSFGRPTENQPMNLATNSEPIKTQGVQTPQNLNQMPSSAGVQGMQGNNQPILPPSSGYPQFSQANPQMPQQNINKPGTPGNNQPAPNIPQAAQPGASQVFTPLTQNFNLAQHVNPNHFTPGLLPSTQSMPQIPSVQQATQPITQPGSQQNVQQKPNQPPSIQIPQNPYPQQFNQQQQQQPGMPNLQSIPQISPNNAQNTQVSYPQNANPNINQSLPQIPKGQTQPQIPQQGNTQTPSQSIQAQFPPNVNPNIAQPFPQMPPSTNQQTMQQNPNYPQQPGPQNPQNMYQQNLPQHLGMSMNPSLGPNMNPNVNLQWGQQNQPMNPGANIPQIPSDQKGNANQPTTPPNKGQTYPQNPNNAPTNPSQQQQQQQQQQQYPSYPYPPNQQFNPGQFNPNAPYQPNMNPQGQYMNPPPQYPMQQSQYPMQQPYGVQPGPYPMQYPGQPQPGQYPYPTGYPSNPPTQQDQKSLQATKNTSKPDKNADKNKKQAQTKTPTTGQTQAQNPQQGQNQMPGMQPGQPMMGSYQPYGMPYYPGYQGQMPPNNMQYPPPPIGYPNTIQPNMQNPQQGMMYQNMQGNMQGNIAQSIPANMQGQPNYVNPQYGGNQQQMPMQMPPYGQQYPGPNMNQNVRQK